MRLPGCLAFVLGVALGLTSQGWPGSAVVFDVRAYGAKGNSSEKSTEAINQAGLTLSGNRMPAQP